MSKITDEMIARYVDGELDAEGVAAVDAAVAADPALGARIVRESHLRAVAARALDDVLTEPVPERLRQPVEASARSAEIIKLDFKKPRGAPVAPARPKPARSPAWAAAAACLVVGLLVAQALGMIRTKPFETAPQAGQPASAALTVALDRKLSGEAGLVRVGLSFRDGGGQVCRTFQIDRTAGVACRREQGWSVRMAADAPAAPAGGSDYRMAASATPPAVLEAVDAMIVGETLDRPQEIAARKAGWK